MENNRPATLSPSGFAKMMTSYGLTDAQAKKYKELTTRDKPLTDIMKNDLEKLEEIIKNPFSKTAISYAEEVVQLMIGVQPDNYVSYDMQRGIDLEPLVIEKYEQLKMVEVYGKQRYYHPNHKFVSGEPDGRVGKKGGVEVKCPNQNNHFRNLMEGAQIEDYKWQLQGYMWILDLDWIDFCSYNQDYPEKYQLSINRVLRDEGMIFDLATVSVKFWHEIVLPIHEKVKQL